MLPRTPPAPRTPAENHPTLLITIWASGCCALLLLFRLTARFLRLHRLHTDDTIAALSLLPLTLRTVAAAAALTLGPAHTDTTLLRTRIPDDAAWAHELRLRAAGAKWLLLARCTYVVYVFLQRACALEFYARLARSLFWERALQRWVWGARAMVVAAAAAGVAASLLECRPLREYWRVGGGCRAAYGQLLTLHAATVVTDAVLVVGPWWPVLRSGFARAKKARLLLTFSLGVFAVATAGLRVWFVVRAHGEQQQRSLWASLDCLVVTLVCNAVVINGFVNDRGERRGSRSVGPGGMPATRLQDENLVLRCAT